MESAPSRSLQGVAEEVVEVDDINEIEIVIGDLKAPNKDTNTVLSQEVLLHQGGTGVCRVAHWPLLFEG